jgi:D-alanyl-D-alanine carboxypeptidase
MFEDLIEELQEPARELVAAAGAAGLLPRVTSTRRSSSLQTQLYRRFQQGRSRFPAAPPGSSAHEFGYAFDMLVTPFEALSDVGYTWQQWGGVWGSQRDPIHFEYPGFVAPAPAEAQESSSIAKFIERWFLQVGPWYASISGASLLKHAVAIEKQLGFDAALDWFYRHVGTNPDK